MTSSSTIPAPADAGAEIVDRVRFAHSVVAIRGVVGRPGEDRRARAAALRRALPRPDAEDESSASAIIDATGPGRHRIARRVRAPAIGISRSASMCASVPRHPRNRACSLRRAHDARGRRGPLGANSSSRSPSSPARTTGTRIVWAHARQRPDPLLRRRRSGRLAGARPLGEQLRRLVETRFAARARAARRAGAAGGDEPRGHGLSGEEVVVLAASTRYRRDGQDRSCRDPRAAAVPRPWLESPAALGPLIDPTCIAATVRPHARRARAPEVSFYVIGKQSYGRAPTFSSRHRYDGALGGRDARWDREAALRVELDLRRPGCARCPRPARPLQLLRPAPKELSAAASCCA